MKKGVFISILALIFLCADSNDDSLIESVIAGLKKYTEELPIEKAHLHIDKPYYGSGETIWFKAYLAAGPIHQLSPLSKVLYIELINESRLVLLKSKILLEDGVGSGNINIPDELPSGNYTLRAYTNFMRNYNEGYHFHREIKIWNLDNPTTLFDDSKEEKISIQLFPEGGDLVHSIRSKVGFKITDENNKGLQTSVKLYDENGNIIDELKPIKHGMGYFYLIPEEGAKYIAKLSDGREINLTIPEATNAGLVMQVTNNPKSEEVVIRIQSRDIQDGNVFSVIAHARNTPTYAAKVDVSSSLAFVKIPKEKLLEGVNVVTIFDKKGIPVSERLVLIEPTRKLDINLTSNKSKYETREKIELDIQVSDANGGPIEGYFSMSVIDAQQILMDENQDNIISNFYLSSDISGVIENAGYYFNEENVDRYEAVDALLLTQGWRRFNWDKVLQKELPEEAFYIEQGLNIKGKLLNSLTKKPIEDGKITFLSSAEDGDLIMTTSNKNGEFIFTNLVFYDSTEVLLQGENKRGNKGVVFSLDSVNPVRTDYLTPSSLSQSLENYQKEFIAKSIERKNIDASYQFEGKTIILDGVEIRGEKIEEEFYGAYGRGTNSLKFSDLPGSQSFLHPLQALQGRVSGVLITGSGLSYSIQIRGAGSFTNNTPLILVDDIATSVSALNQIPARDIERVEIFKGPEAAVFGSQGANGVLAFYTKRGGVSDLERQGIINISLDGLSTLREFYSPDYTTSKPEHIKPDKRVLVHWEPLIKTDSAGKAKITFFSTDEFTRLTAYIEGINEVGLVGKSTVQLIVSNEE